MKLRNRLIFPVILGALFLAPVLCRPPLESRARLDEAHARFTAGNADEGIVLLGDAVAWRAFGNAPAEEAARELSARASDSSSTESLRKHARAHLLRGLASSRSWMWSYRKFWQNLNYAELEKSVIEDKIGAPPKITLVHSPPQIHFGWQAASHLCLLTWLGGTIAIIWHCFEPSGQVRLKRGTRLVVGGASVALVFSLWLLALSLA